jgi:hypothetical protein
MEAARRKPEWFFYPAWVVASALPVPIAWFIGWAIISQVERVAGGTIEVAGRTRITEDFLFGYVFVPLLGLLTGFLQYLLLRRYLPRIGWWIAATALGWPLGIAGVYLVYAALPAALEASSTWPLALVLVSVGGATGLAQWLVLRRRVRRAGWWILASALGCGLVRLAAGEAFTSLLEQLMVGVVPGIVTAMALWWLLGWQE